MKARIRSASVGPDKKSEFRARYWAFLFENLYHAVDELYQTCEIDENTSQCKEVILVLENYTREFRNLVEWFRLKWEYENTPPPQRPTSLAWEVRKSSSGKVLQRSERLDRRKNACRKLVFELGNISKSGNGKPLYKKNILAAAADCRFPEEYDKEEYTRGVTQISNCEDKYVAKDGEKLPTQVTHTIIESNTCISKRIAVAAASSACTEEDKQFSNRILPNAQTSFRRSKTDFFISCSSANMVGDGAGAIARSQSDCDFQRCLTQKRVLNKAYVDVSHMKNTGCTSLPSKLQDTSNLSKFAYELKKSTPAVVVKKEAKVKGSWTKQPATTNAEESRYSRVRAKGTTISCTKSSFINAAAANAKRNTKEISTGGISIPDKKVKVTVRLHEQNGKNSEQKNNGNRHCSLDGKKVKEMRRVPPPTLHYNRIKCGKVEQQSCTTKETCNENISVAAAAAAAAGSGGEKAENEISHKNCSSSSSSMNNRKINETKTWQQHKYKPVNGNTVIAVGNVRKARYSNHDDTTIKKQTQHESAAVVTSAVYGNAKYCNLTRSKTAIVLLSNAPHKRKNSRSSNVTLVKKVDADKALSVAANDGKPSAKDVDGWETVTSRSRRFSSNSTTLRKNAFNINKRFYEPSSSSSLPLLGTVELKKNDGGGSGGGEKNIIKEKEAIEIKSVKNRNRNNSCGMLGADFGGSGGGGIRQTIKVGEYPPENCKLSEERPIISNIAMFTTIQPSKKNNILDKNKKLKQQQHCKDEKLTRCKLKTSNATAAAAAAANKTWCEKKINTKKKINELRSGNHLKKTAAASDFQISDTDVLELCTRSEKDYCERSLLGHLCWETEEETETLSTLRKLISGDAAAAAAAANENTFKLITNLNCIKQFEDLVTRSPGRALELHQKLSSPSRKRISPDTTILQHKERQAKAKQNREQLLQDKSAKIRELFNKVAEVKAMQVQLAAERRKLLEQKLKRAEKNRNLHLKTIQEKAHDEAKKQREIAFINELEAQNKRHDFYALCQEQEDRLQSILEERQRRQEEKAAKEAAVEERRKALEAERQEKIEELQEKMRKREERIDRELQEKEKERIKIAKEKARDREDRLLALQAAQIANAEELQKKIQQKQENSARRHEENIELIRQKAIEIGAPRLTPYQINKLCSVCDVIIDSEVFLLSHLKGRSHQDAIKKYREQFETSIKFNERYIIKDAPADVLLRKKTREEERQKTLEKRCKKIRYHLLLRSEEYMKAMCSENGKSEKINLKNKTRMLKSIKEMEKLLNSQGNGSWPSNAVAVLERNLFEIIRLLEKGNEEDQRAFKEFNGFAILSRIYNLALDVPKNMAPYLPLKCFLVSSTLYTMACENNSSNCTHVLLSNGIIQISDFLLNRLKLIMPNNDNRNGTVIYAADSIADMLMKLCSNILANINISRKNNEEKLTDDHCDNILLHLQDVVSYIVCVGIVDKLAIYCSSVHDNKSSNPHFLLHSIQLLTQLVETREGKGTEKDDCTQLMATLKATELVGAVSMLYGILLHQDTTSNGTRFTVSNLKSEVVGVITATLQLFRKVGELNLEFFQNILGAEGISLQVRHIISFLLRYCAQNECCADLLHQVIEFIGFFAIHHHDNQMILQSGSTPTVLQQLSNLPFEYFSNPDLTRILFPTLLACCVENSQNKAFLDQELSFQLMEEFQNAESSKNIPLIQLL